MLDIAKKYRKIGVIYHDTFNTLYIYIYIVITNLTTSSLARATKKVMWKYDSKIYCRFSSNWFSVDYRSKAKFGKYSSNGRSETIYLRIRNWKGKINVAFSFVSPDGNIIFLTFDILMKEMLFELLTLTRTDFLCISRVKFFLWKNRERCRRRKNKISYFFSWDL